MLQKRKEICTFDKLKPAVEEMTRRYLYSLHKNSVISGWGYNVECMQQVSVLLHLVCISASLSSVGNTRIAT